MIALAFLKRDFQAANLEGTYNEGIAQLNNSMALYAAHADRGYGPTMAQNKKLPHYIDLWDSLQTMGCCGFQGPADWEVRPPEGANDLDTSRTQRYPLSCCPQDVSDERVCLAPYQVGCEKVILYYSMVSAKVFFGYVVLHVCLVFTAVLVLMIDGFPKLKFTKVRQDLEA